MKEIVFVDDELLVLIGLRRTLRQMKDQWCINYFPSAQEALDYTDHTNVDVLVTDLRMPNIDGMSLISEWHKRSPQTAFVIYSGYCCDEVAERARKYGVILLAKPCTAESLVEAIVEASWLKTEKTRGDWLDELLLVLTDKYVGDDDGLEFQSVSNGFDQSGTNS